MAAKAQFRIRNDGNEILIDDTIKNLHVKNKVSLIALERADTPEVLSRRININYENGTIEETRTNLEVNNRVNTVTYRVPFSHDSTIGITWKKDKLAHIHFTYSDTYGYLIGLEGGYDYSGMYLYEYESNATPSAHGVGLRVYDANHELTFSSEEGYHTFFVMAETMSEDVDNLIQLIPACKNATDSDYLDNWNGFVVKFPATQVIWDDGAVYVMSATCFAYSYSYGGYTYTDLHPRAYGVVHSAVFLRSN